MAGENEEGDKGAGGAGDDNLSDNEKRLMAELAERNKDLEAERARATAAERGRVEAEKRATDAGASVQDSQISQLDATIASMEMELSSLENQIEAASAEGNHRQVATLTRKIGRIEAEKLTLENGKVAIESAKAAGPMQRQQPRGAGDATSDPAENVAQQIQAQGFHRSARWIRSNPQFARDQGLWNKLQIVHQTFITKFGPEKADSDAYFDFVENHEFIAPELGRRTSQNANGSGAANGNDNGGGAGGDDARSGAAAGRERSNGADRTPPAAPPSRGGNSRGVRLTPEQQEAARMSGQTDAEYAENADALLKAERIGPKARTH